MRIIVNELASNDDLGIESYRKVIDISEDQLVRIFNTCSEIKDKEKEPLFEELSTQQRVKAAALVIRDFCKQHVSCKICPFSLNTKDKDNQAYCPFYKTIPAKWYEEGDN